ncbi:hypothetical protein M514_21121 [Trichuris suis]|uniref:Uncharacterized protein n=1 Tax=Trichuris suis TaxID=68888 RepID=A0A085NBC6_9BILA|nr:hypothetical protein M514_21121 [Trichuris suis]
MSQPQRELRRDNSGIPQAATSPAHTHLLPYLLARHEPFRPYAVPSTGHFRAHRAGQDSSISTTSRYLFPLPCSRQEGPHRDLCAPSSVHWAVSIASAIVQCPVSVVHCPVLTDHCPLSSVHCPLFSHRTHDTRHATHDTLHATHDTRHATHDMRHATHYTRHATGSTCDM